MRKPKGSKSPAIIGDARSQTYGYYPQDRNAVTFNTYAVTERTTILGFSFKLYCIGIFVVFGLFFLISGVITTIMYGFSSSFGISGIVTALMGGAFCAFGIILAIKSYQNYKFFKYRAKHGLNSGVGYPEIPNQIYNSTVYDPMFISQPKPSNDKLETLQDLESQIVILDRTSTSRLVTDHATPGSDIGLSNQSYMTSDMSDKVMNYDKQVNKNSTTGIGDKSTRVEIEDITNPQEVETLLSAANQLKDKEDEAPLLKAPLEQINGEIQEIKTSDLGNLLTNSNSLEEVQDLVPVKEETIVKTEAYLCEEPTESSPDIITNENGKISVDLNGEERKNSEPSITHENLEEIKDLKFNSESENSQMKQIQNSADDIVLL